MFIPTVHDDKAAFDIYSRLLKDRIILLTGEVNSQSAELIISELLYLSAESSQPISFYINSPGGSVTDGLAILDTMHLIKTPVLYTYCVGQCASMGAVLLAGGTKGHRFALENSRVMIHMVRSGASGQIIDIKKSIEEGDRLNDKLMELLAKYTGKTLKKVSKDCERDYFMSADEALEYGIVDKVLKTAV